MRKETIAQLTNEDIIITKLQVDKVLAEEQGELTSAFHYVASKETGISLGGDTYVSVVYTHIEEFAGTYEEIHLSYAPLILENEEFWTEEMLQHVRPISAEEYAARTKDEEVSTNQKFIISVRGAWDKIKKIWKKG